MSNIKQFDKNLPDTHILSKRTLEVIQTRLEAVQPMKMPQLALKELHDNIRNSETIMVLLGEQIVTTHNLIMTLALRAGIEIKNGLNNRLPATNATAKLINAFTRQIELLENLKAPEAKKINITQMNISENGQAFVRSYSKN